MVAGVSTARQHKQFQFKCLFALVMNIEQAIKTKHFHQHEKVRN